MARKPADPAAELLSRDALRERALAAAAQRGRTVARRRLALRWLAWGLGRALLWGGPVVASGAALWWLATQWHR